MSDPVLVEKIAEKIQNAATASGLPVGAASDLIASTPDLLLRRMTGAQIRANAERLIEELNTDAVVNDHGADVVTDAGVSAAPDAPLEDLLLDLSGALGALTAAFQEVAELTPVQVSEPEPAPTPLRLKSLQLGWFRGAAAEFRLEMNGRSAVIYGPNGAGKSSLVDGLEYILSGGRVEHLANEYSGRRFEHAVPNTHTPEGQASTIEVVLQDGNKTTISIDESGRPTASGGQHIANWMPARSILRQDMLADFVKLPKSDKYGVVLPLLGLQPLEDAAANLKAIRQEAERVSKLSEMRGELTRIRRRRNEAFPNADDEAVAQKIRDLFGAYLPAAEMPETLQEQVDLLRPEIERRIAGLDAANRVNLLLCQARDAGLEKALSSCSSLAFQAAEAAERILKERLAVLRAASAFSNALEPEEDGGVLDCPACGREVPVKEFAAHVASESERLKAALALDAERRVAGSATVTALGTVQRALSGTEMKAYLSSLDWGEHVSDRDSLLAFDPARLEGEEAATALSELTGLADAVLPTIVAAAQAAPKPTQQLVRDNNTILAAADWDSSRTLMDEIEKTEALVDFLTRAEEAIRSEIRIQAEAVIADISNDIATMWAILHPQEPIDGVALYQHPDADKAIDLKLRFHGKEQPSPRLTLSEGHRNSLGLCVFLAFAKRGTEPMPIVLDDVVTSFDREHRDSVIDLLIGRFQDRQLLVLTHDFDWFIELNNRLPAKDWTFQQLRPFTDPSVGIQWSTSPGGFEPARALLEIDHSAAGNKARGLLDQHLAITCHKLAIKMPFIRGPRNDQRHALEMLTTLSSAAASAFKVRQPGNAHVPSTALRDAAKDLAGLMVPFANPPSHGRAITKREAERIIDGGEQILKELTCGDCAQKVYYANAGDNHLQCQCGKVRWKL